MSRATLIVLLFSICLFGCFSTTKPVVWTSNDIVFADVQYFDVQPVANATGHTVMQDIPIFLTNSLKQQFLARNLQLVDGQQIGNAVLIVQSEILKYKFQYFTGPPPPSRNIIGLCILRTRLIQERTGHVVGEIITTNQVDVGRGMLEAKSPDSLLQESAAQIAREVAKMR
jgi:hypothetical protein